VRVGQQPEIFVFGQEYARLRPRPREDRLVVGTGNEFDDRSHVVANRAERPDHPEIAALSSARKRTG
jgi:hypothetical protein